MKVHRFILRYATLLIAIAAMVPIARAQSHDMAGTTGIIEGTVRDASGTPLPGVTVRVIISIDTSAASDFQKRNIANTAKYTYTNSVGKYHVGSLGDGNYNVTYSLLGYLDKSYNVDVHWREPDTLNTELAVQPLASQDVVITASRHEEKETHSPASISVVTAAQIQDQVDATPTDALKNVPGMDVASEGIGTSTYASRSFHSVYGSDMLTMNDYHSLEVPALAVYYGILIPQTMEDIDHIEVVRGPGSALYGPEAATGVVNFISKSPFASQGTNLSIAGGERDYINADFRHAEAFGDKFAFAISGHYLEADDWHDADDPKEDTARKYAQAALATLRETQEPLLQSQYQSEVDSLSRIGNRDYNLQVYSFNARMDANLTDDLAANLTAGVTNIGNDIAMTEDFGDAQIKNWLYDFVQGRVTDGDLFIQGSVNHDNTSGSYFLPTGAPLIDRSSTYVAQIQDQWKPFANEKFTYGADYKAITPFSDSTIYGPDDGHANTQILGAYLQSQTTFFDQALELDLAAREDKDYAGGTDLTPIFSPRAAVVYHFDDNNLIRAMYNNTYLLPSEVDLYANLLFSTDAYGIQSQPSPFNTLPTTTIRYVTPYVSGMNFVPDSGGWYTVGSNVLGNTTYKTFPAFWQALMQLAAKLSNQPILAGIPAPANPITYLAYLNLNTKTFDPTAAPINISPVQPQQQRTLEMDYQGAVGKTFQYEVDAYQTHYTAIRASTVALTPNVFVDSAEAEQYFKSVFSGVPGADSISRLLAGNLSKLPIGVVQPTGGAPDETSPEDLLVGTRGYLENDIQFYGIDFFGTIMANADWSFDGSFSWLNKNYWYAGELNAQDSTNQSPFALNLPKYRASIGAKYSGLMKGLSVELRDRWSDAFLMDDNYWIGSVASQHVVDLTINYRPESWNNLQLTLSVTNLLNNLHEEFVGAPYIGRLTVLRAAYTLPPF